MNLLLQHLLDTAAVAELTWDHYLAPTVRAKVDACCGGKGRSLLALLCGVHDVGKASPAFQMKEPELAERVRDVGLDLPALDGRGRRWHHSSAGAVVVQRALLGAGWDFDACEWVWPLVAGHHGVILGGEIVYRDGWLRSRDKAQGRGAWEPVQDALVRRVAAELGIDLAALVPSPPRRAVQLAVSGLVIMADWIASDERHFTGVCELDQVSMAEARHRAAMAWERLQLGGGWDPGRLPVHDDPVAARFPVPAARRSQAAVVVLAESMPAPGLLIVEAPMGEGKTEAALAAAEVFARRFGADGVFVGMPTQATSDPMFTRVGDWARSIEPDLQIGLLHGKRRFNKEWRELEKQVRFRGVDDYGCDDDPLLGGSAGPAKRVGEFPAEWFLGPKRGLLTPITVGTVDQLLHAATRTRHVMLRHAGLAGRVVVVDEVHAYDIYMAQFLFEALRWLGDAGVPVILLSATLPPELRSSLVGAYLQGAARDPAVGVAGLPAPDGYPSALSACVVDGAPRYAVRSADPWRPSVPVRVEVLQEAPADGPERVVDCVVRALAGGGCALIIRNTVGRAQQTYMALREAFGADTVLLHARLVVGERADRAERVLRMLGRDGPRPGRLVVVATQLAEQSFDVDVDLLVTDLAPIDLLLQRIGRLHRHNRPDRPEGVRSPRVVVAGMASHGDGPPTFPAGSRIVYGAHQLLRTAALVIEAADRSGWSVPAEVPDLVGRGYGTEPLVPESWSEAAGRAREELRKAQDTRRANAEAFLLAGPGGVRAATLVDLHRQHAADMPDDDKVAAVVRDGDPSVEVILVRRDSRGYRTLGGRSIGVDGAAVSDEAVLDDVVQSTVRLPPAAELTKAALDELRPLPGWTADPWLKRARALELDESMSARLGGHALTYDTELGLIDTREATR